MELIVHILVKAVAMEVKGMRLDKRERKEKADLVRSRLKTVSSQWNSILSTDFFQNELHRTLKAQETLRWEVVLQKAPIISYRMRLTAMRDEVFMLFMPHGGVSVLHVFDRNNVAVPKDVIPIPEFIRGDMAACSVSNCVYLLNEDSIGLSVMRIWKDEHQFKVSTWIKNLGLPLIHVAPNIGLSVAANGNLVVLSGQLYPKPKPRNPPPTVVGIYDANGLEQHKISLSPATYGLKYSNSVIQKADGNLVLGCSDFLSVTKLLEIDTSGRIIREYKSEHSGVMCFEDIYGRILVSYLGTTMELLDSDFNFLDVAVPQLDDGKSLGFYHVRYNRDRHEMVGFRWDWSASIIVFVTLRFSKK